MTNEMLDKLAEFEAFINEPLYLAALPSSPAPFCTPHNSGERMPKSDPALGAGEAIFAECAEIALEHVGAYVWPDLRVEGYDEACRDIAEAIKLRASNRRTMDALADKDSTK
jgi:hypothetical protein